ncbi:uncharacterized protein BX663DRAFT_499274 [Cokeromyces recurvatus]|uniref:uncharacterized protein n=1 Tax=Cokeromyces recurvatus TaxID=90255 RepID=UPI00221E4734|nr:uncharacterized protein BX663DRAFT_499274 [Cokeromyces recurvatus]KAI7906213.1 hypothetical protein BX663DRAFT_499274 [Cokeromyces recurvatus]
MRHVRLLHLLTPHLTLKRKTFTPCLGCGRPMFLFQSYTQVTPTSTTTLQKYAHLPAKARPAEPSIAITKLAARGRLADALSVYLKLLKDGGFPSRESLYQLTLAMYQNSNLTGMYIIHQTLTSYYKQNPIMLSKRNARSMTYMYTMLINLISKHSRSVNMDIIQQLCKEMPQFTNNVTLPLYNTLIKILLKKNYEQEAWKLVEELRRQNIGPNIVTYNIFMKHAYKRKNWERFIQLLDEINQDEKLEIDCITTHIVVDTLCSMHAFDKAFDIVEKLFCPTVKDKFNSLEFRLDLINQIEKKRSLALQNAETSKKKKRKKEEDDEEKKNHLLKNKIK